LDWHFMTPDFSWAGRQQQNQFDVVQGHACQHDSSSYDNSYYATSLCYWHPESQHIESQHIDRAWGLGWSGSAREDWCGDIRTQFGVCARCSVCHDNARDRDASADKEAARLEIIPLPDDCMKEGAIEAECLQEFEANNGELAHEDARCREVQTRYDAALASYNSITSTISTSEYAITVLPHQIHEARRQVMHLRRQVRNARRQDEVNRASGQASSLAFGFRHETARWERTLHRRTNELSHHRRALRRAYRNLPAATSQKQFLELEWFPQAQACSHVIATATAARNAHVTLCAPRYYNQSCEKACVEIQRNGEHGCGVIEGSQHGDAFGRGGPEVVCSPPAPSWIMSPSTYGGSRDPNVTEQCNRILSSQSVRATTPVIMSGWLQKACSNFCFGGEKRRFFVLESGNGVRSAVLRYFRDDEALHGGTEHTNKALIMWDAEEVSVAETSDNRACLEIIHHYRGRVDSWESNTTYTLCATREEYPEDSLPELRDQWVSTLQNLLVWQPDAVGPANFLTRFFR